VQTLVPPTELCDAPQIGVIGNGVYVTFRMWRGAQWRLRVVAP
jgi:hypothetical protein